MKKLLLASAVAALSVTAANAAPTIYGKAFLSLDTSSTTTDTTTTVAGVVTNSSSVKNTGRTQLNSNGSRIGFKGSQALTPNTDLLYQLEYGIEVDDNAQQFRARDSYLGLSNAKFGTVMAGRLTAIDDAVNFADVTAGGVYPGSGILVGNLEDANGNPIGFDAPRANNAFAYASPNYNNMQFLAMYVMDENNASDSLGRDATGVAAIYEQGPIKAGASYIHAGTKILRTSASYDINPTITLGGLYQIRDFDVTGSSKESALTVSGEMKTATPWVAYAQGDLVRNVAGNSNSDDYRLVVGGKYKFNKATTGHVYGAYRNQDMKVGDSVNSVRTEISGLGVGGGIEYKF